MRQHDVGNYLGLYYRMRLWSFGFGVCGKRPQALIAFDHRVSGAGLVFYLLGVSRELKNIFYKGYIGTTFPSSRLTASKCKVEDRSGFGYGSGPWGLMLRVWKSN